MSPNRFFRLTGAALIFHLSAGIAAAQEPSPPASAPRAVWRQPLALRDVAASQLVGWLKRFGVELPMSIEGRISFAMQAGIPLDWIGEARAYELDGVVTSPKLVVGGVTLLDLSASLRYRDGVMDWPELRFRLPRRGEATGAASIAGSGRVRLAPLGDFEIRADVADFDLATIADFSGAPLPLSGSASGRANVRVAQSDFAKLASWSGDAALATRAVRLPGLNSPSAEAAFRFAGDTLNFERLRGVINDVPLGLAGAVKLAADFRTLALEGVRLDVFGGAITARGRVPLAALSPQDLAIEAQNLDLALLDRQLRPVLTALGLEAAPPLSGSLSFGFDGAVPFGKLEDYSGWRIRRGQVSSPYVRFGRTAIERLTAAGTFDGVRLQLAPLQWDFPADSSPDGRAGRVDVRASGALNLLGRVEIKLNADHVPLVPFSPSRVEPAPLTDA